MWEMLQKQNSLCVAQKAKNTWKMHLMSVVYL